MHFYDALYVFNIGAFILKYTNWSLFYLFINYEIFNKNNVGDK